MSASRILSEDRFEQDLLDLVRKSGTRLDPVTFISRISNIYHRIESDNYDEIHTEILREEVTRLRGLLSKALNLESLKELRVIDVGCGTGHASKILISTCLSKRIGLSLVGIDLSKEMLSICQGGLRDGKQIKTFLVQSDIEAINASGDCRFDLVITSSVLHHIPNIYKFAQHISSILRPGGIWVMSHEPNGLDHIAKLQWCRYTYARLMQARKRILSKMRSIFGYNYSAYGNKPQILDAVSMAIFEEGITPACQLTRREIRGLIDIHTINPHPGSFNIGYEGFDISNLSTALAGLDLNLTYSETYSHLGLVRDMNRTTRLLNTLLQARYPEGGTIVSCLWKKGR